MSEAFEQAKRNFEDFLRTADEWRRTPVDVAGTTDDDELDDHLSTRVSTLAGAASRDEVLLLPEDLRSYFLTRLFEWLNATTDPRRSSRTTVTCWILFQRHIVTWV